MSEQTGWAEDSSRGPRLAGRTGGGGGGIVQGCGAGGSAFGRRAGAVTRRGAGVGGGRRGDGRVRSAVGSRREGRGWSGRRGRTPGRTGPAAGRGCSTAR